MMTACGHAVYPSSGWYAFLGRVGHRPLLCPYGLPRQRRPPCRRVPQNLPLPTLATCSNTALNLVSQHSARPSGPGRRLGRVQRRSDRARRHRHARNRDCQPVRQPWHRRSRSEHIGPISHRDFYREVPGSRGRWTACSQSALSETSLVGLPPRVCSQLLTPRTRVSATTPEAFLVPCTNQARFLAMVFTSCWRPPTKLGRRTSARKKSRRRSSSRCGRRRRLHGHSRAEEVRAFRRSELGRNPLTVCCGSRWLLKNKLHFVAVSKARAG